MGCEAFRLSGGIPVTTAVRTPSIVGSRLEPASHLSRISIMKRLLLLSASVALFPLPMVAQRPAQRTAQSTAQSTARDEGPPGPTWKPIVPGRPVFITADSISKLGTDSFRYVIFRRLGDAESTETAEVQCGDHTRRTVRLVTRGKYIVPDKSGKRVKAQATPNDSFEKPYPGGAADVILQRACDMGHAKFRPAMRR